jgi:hypothetical protein
MPIVFIVLIVFLLSFIFYLLSFIYYLLSIFIVFAPFAWGKEAGMTVICLGRCAAE